MTAIYQNKHSYGRNDGNRKIGGKTITADKKRETICQMKVSVGRKEQERF